MGLPLATGFVGLAALARRHGGIVPEPAYPAKSIPFSRICYPIVPMAVCLVGFTLRPVASTGNLISEIAPHSTNPKGSRMGLFYLMATPAQPLVEPAIKRAVAFIDGQNLFHHARQAFGYHYPNY